VHSFVRLGFRFSTLLPSIAYLTHPPQTTFCTLRKILFKNEAENMSIILYLENLTSTPGREREGEGALDFRFDDRFIVLTA
jgi:hypothetical protein